MKVVTAEKMQAIDKAMIEGKGIPGLDLMESAGTGVAERIIDLLGDTRGHNVSIFCGKGNNGGDGLVVARRLAESDIFVKVFLFADVKSLTADAKHNYDHLPEKVTVFQVGKDDDLTEIAEQIPNEDIIVDALLGTGLKGPVTKEIERVIEIINKYAKHVVSVDIPSGVEGSTGKIGNIAVKADHTITMGIPKLGLFLQPGGEYAGEVSVVDLGIHDDVMTQFEFKYDILDDDMAKMLLPERKPVSHKGYYGRVLLIGGSRGMGGAIALASKAVLRSGAGMVIAATPLTIQNQIASKLMEVMTEPLSENSKGTITPKAIDELKRALEWADVVAIGPGIGVNDDVVEFMGKFLEICEHPLLIDADGIKCVTPHKSRLKNRKCPVVITPHPRELAYFLGMDAQAVLDDYFKVTLDASVKYGISIHTKVHRSVTANPDGFATINVTGNSGMSTAGSGDVLTGIIAGILAQGASIYDSTRLGAYLHGLAGDLAARDLGEYSMISGDLLKYLPKAIMRVLCGEG